MKNTLLILLIVIGISYSNFSHAQRGKKNKLENKVDSVSYAIGLSFGKSIKDQNITELDIDKLSLAIQDMLAGEDQKIAFEDAQSIIQNYITELKEKQKQDNLIKANEFLESNKTREGVFVTPSGLQYEIITEGNGQSPTLANRVKTHYKGTLLDGTVFDSSYERGEPISFGVGRVIDGWKEALQLMKPGAKWKLYIHPDLGYGENATGPIPPNSLLIFEIELLSIE